MLAEFPRYELVSEEPSFVVTVCDDVIQDSVLRQAGSEHIVRKLILITTVRYIVNHHCILLSGNYNTHSAAENNYTMQHLSNCIYSSMNMFHKDHTIRCMQAHALYRLL